MSLRAVSIALAGVLGGAACLAAQAETPRSPELERQRAERSLQQSRAEADRLFELRLRHDLGLLPAASLDATERAFTPSAPATAEALDRMQAQLREEAAATAVLRESYERARAVAEQARADAEAKAVEAARQPIVAVPAAGRPAPTTTPTRASRQRQEAAANAPLALLDAPAAPAGESAAPSPAAPAPAAVPPTSLQKLGPVQAQIVGCNDHQRIAAALLKAGQALVDEASARREAGDAAGARQLADRANERLRRALEVLAPHGGKDAPFEVLFCQGRALELLFRHAERYEGVAPGGANREWEKREQEVRTPWLQIAARDVVKAADAEVLGPWGKAAQAALEHFRWTNLHGAYDAAATIDAIVWPGADAK